MVEQEQSRQRAETATSTLFLRKVLPHAITVKIGDKLLGQGLSEEGHKQLRSVLKKILNNQPIEVSREIPLIYKDSQFTFTCQGQEHIPASGTTLFIGNHTRSGPLAGMGQYFEASRIAYERRTDVEDHSKREPKAIAQKGLTKVFKLPGGTRYVWTLPLTEQFYELAADSLNWIVISAPKFDKNGQILNRQNLPQGVVDDFLGGQALFWYPQGKHMETHDLAMPEKGTSFLTKLKNEDVTIVPVRFIPTDNVFRIHFGRPVHIQDLPPNGNGQLDINHFAQNHLEPLSG